MFDFFKKKKTAIGSPVKGTAIALSGVSDPTFGEGILGKGIAVIPEDGKVYAPADGVIEQLFDTLHAFTLKTEEGIEILVHIGLDTVKLKGTGFESHIRTGNHVKKGDLLITVDLETVKNAGLDIVTPIVICNTDDYQDIKAVGIGESVSPQTTILEVIMS